MDLLEKNAELKEIRELHERIERRESMTFRDNVYWRVTDGQEEGPFCPGCLDGTDHLTARLIGQDGRNHWRCPVCNEIVIKPEAQKIQPNRKQTHITPWS